MRRRHFISLMAAGAATAGVTRSAEQRALPASIRKLKDLIVYRDPMYYCISPSVLTRRDGEVLVAFRRAPERRAFGEKSSGHSDPKSHLVLVRSRDGGASWSQEPELMFAHPLGGAQDACLLELSDGSIVCHSYAWLRLNENAERSRPAPAMTTRGAFNFLGGFVLRSDDGGRTWKGPFRPPPMPHPDALDSFGNRVPMFNRGSMCQGRDGVLYWSARSLADRLTTGHYNLHLLASTDRGETWRHLSDMARDPDVSFTETSLIETPRGDLVGFVRALRMQRSTSAARDDLLQGTSLDAHLAVVVRSTDRGRTFQPWRDAGFFGFPFHALKLPDGRVWLSYGYRRKPFGIRARILNPECTDISTAPEIVLRDDGGTSDVGYPWATLLPDGRILTVYWINLQDGERHIAGTICG